MQRLIILEGESDFTIRMFADGPPPPPTAPRLLSHDQMEEVLNQCTDPSTFSKTNHVAPIRWTI